MASNWDQVRVADLLANGALAINDGYRVRNVELGREGIPFVRGGDIGDGTINFDVEDRIRPQYTERVRSKLTRPYDVAFITKGTVGRVGLVRPNQPEGVFAPQVCYWRSLDWEVVDPRFLYYLLTSAEFQANLDAVKTHGSMVADYVSMTDQKNFRLTFPPIRNQRAIGRLLGALDDKIELNRRMNATLEGISRAIFKSWFVDFDPVRQKVAGKQPVGMDARTAALFPDSFEDSDVGEVPNGWRVQPISELAEIVGGSTPSTKERLFWDGGSQCWATPKDLSDLSVPVLLETERQLTDTGVSQITSGVLPVGTVLLSSRAPIGYLAVAETPVAINQGFIAMKPKEGVSNLFLLRWTGASHDEIVSRANGSTFLEISKTNFRPISVVQPPQAVMDAFHERAFSLFRRVVACERASRTLAALRGTLLPKLLSGEVRVPEAEGIVEEAVR
jgi:type I restriction enzyme S subunit